MLEDAISQTEVAMFLARTQLFTLFRDTKWLGAVSIALAGLLYFPAQINELYRAILADRNYGDLLQFYLPLLALGVIVWFGANQVALESTSRQPAPHSRSLRFLTRAWPIFLGILPVAASSLGQYLSIPANAKDAAAALEQGGLLPGSPFYQFDETLTKTVGDGLWWSSIATISGAIIVAGIVSWVAGKWENAFHRANRRYFIRWRMLLITIALIAIVSGLLLQDPVALPQHLGTFVLITIFALLLVGFCIHISLATIHHKLPIFPAIFLCVIAFSLADRTDNHEIRLLKEPPSQSAQSDAASEFKRWFASRDDIKQYKDEYPVYVVAAQGGGIYAAYESAIFLARMQDQCPAFRKHLFAISSVSGGSIGAAVFASVLAAHPAEASGSVACPAMSKYLEKSARFDSSFYTAGEIEGYARGILSPKNDLLSPLVAGTLFGDFTQRFWPWAIGGLDRARTLEYGLEAAGAGDKKDSLLSGEYIAHWGQGKEIPALLLNTTDAASGRRVVLAPFTFRTNTATQVDSLVPFQSLIPTEGRTEALNPRLSTAAFISARFPWVSPAATIPAKVDSDSTDTKTRLVDGGYFDNSGVETAVDLVQALQAQIDELNAAGSGPKIVVKLIVLGGGHYPMRDSFALGETMEPIRALLSTRESRAYIAINKAARAPQLQERSFERMIGGSTETITTKSLRLVGLRKHAYELPLGWAMSLRTREIIENQSGHFWDCDPNSDFTQSDEVSGSSGDCVQLLIGNELNGTLDSAVQELAVKQHYAMHVTARPAAETRLDKPTIVRCLAGITEPAVHLPQARLMIRLLREWDYYPAVKDPRMLAYILGTAFHETSNLRVFSENLSYKTPQRILAVFARRFDMANPAAALADAAKYVNAPQQLAGRVYDGRPDLGNTNPGDGWRYRGRGILQLTGRADYSEHGAVVGEPLEAEPDLMFNDDVATRVLFSHFLSRQALDRYFPPGQEAKWQEARAVVAGGSPAEAALVAQKSKKIMGCLPPN